MNSAKVQLKPLGKLSWGFSSSLHFRAELCTCLCILLMMKPIQGLVIYCWAGVSLGDAVSTSTAQHGANQLGTCWLLVPRPEADAPCHEYLRVSCCEGCLFLCMTLSLSLSSSVRWRQIILLHDKYLHLSWKLGN